MNNLLNLKLRPAKKFLVVILLLVLSCVSYNTYYLINLFGSQGLGLPAPMVEFNSQVLHLTMLIPSKWYISNLPQGNHGDFDSKTVIQSPFFSAVYIQIFTHEFNNKEVQNVIDWGKQKAQSNSGYQEISFQPYANPKYPGFVYEYTRPVYARPVKIIWQSDTYRCIDWFVISLNNGYDFSFCSLDKSWPYTKDIFQKIIDSIQFDQ
jgi:hypothetical protein